MDLHIANAAFGSGNEIGTGNYVIYVGTGTSVDLTSLSSSTTYHLQSMNMRLEIVVIYII